LERVSGGFASVQFAKGADMWWLVALLFFFDFGHHCQVDRRVGNASTFNPRQADNMMG
jgi:hypothetical protein